MSAELKPVSIVPEREPQLPTVATPMSMLAQAVEKGMAPETIDKLMTLAERWEANQARKAFNEAFSAFKAEAVTVYRNRDVTDGPLKGRKYAELVSFVDAATPALSKHGLSASWEITRDEEKWIEVTCIIEHNLGHNKRVPVGGPPDVGGAKNLLQARISTITYLERASFKAACGLAEQGDDKDGRNGANGATITEDQATQLIDLMESVTADRAKFLKFFQIESIMSLPAGKFNQAMDMLKQKAKG